MKVHVILRNNEPIDFVPLDTGPMAFIAKDCATDIAKAYANQEVFTLNQLDLSAKRPYYYVCTANEDNAFLIIIKKKYFNTKNIVVDITNTCTYSVETREANDYTPLQE